jgi:hypothetical protein
MTRLECNFPGIEGYSAASHQDRVFMIHAHRKGSAGPEYDWLASHTPCHWIYMPINPGEYVARVWLSPRRLTSYNKSRGLMVRIATTLYVYAADFLLTCSLAQTAESALRLSTGAPRELRETTIITSVIRTIASTNRQRKEPSSTSAPLTRPSPRRRTMLTSPSRMQRRTGKQESSPSRPWQCRHRWRSKTQATGISRPAG